MNLKGKQVRHATYGEGTIIDCSDAYITVKYAMHDGKYQFPQAFLNKFLTLTSAEENAILIEALKQSAPKQKTVQVTAVKKVDTRESAPVSAQFRRADNSEHSQGVEVVYAQTNAEFLNSKFGTDFKGFYKSGFPLSSNTLVWMIKIDGTVNLDWQNNWVKEINGKFEIVTGSPHNKFDTILEQYFGNDNVDVKHEYRIVAEKDFSKPVHKYFVHGRFKLDKSASTSKTHVWRKVN